MATGNDEANSKVSVIGKKTFQGTAENEKNEVINNSSTGMPDGRGRAGAKNIKKVAIIGLPNTGKSQIFNNLTGEYTIVANYHGTTVEMKRSITWIHHQCYEIIDTPSLHCLYIHSEEEIAVRDMLFTEKPDIIIQCIDAGQFKQSLALTADIMELNIPMVIVLNLIQESAQKGVWVDADELKRELGVPVIESMATRGIGKEELKNAIAKARVGRSHVTYSALIENEIAGLSAELPDEIWFKRKAATLLLLKDQFLEEYLRVKFGKEKIVSILDKVTGIRRQINSNVRNTINDRRSAWVDHISSVCVRRHQLAVQQFSDYFAMACRHPILGIPILLVLLAGVYISMVYVSGFLDKILNSYVVKPSVWAITSLSLPRFWNELLIGPHGILTLGVFNAICTVLPILSVFFFVFGFFEDSGYIANFCVLSKRLFEKIGVTGKAVTSLVLGFGCKTMATLNTRGLTNRKEKLITIFLIAFAIPCSAQLGINMAILGKVGAMAFLIAFGTLFVFEVGAGIIMNFTIKEDIDSCFIQVLPQMRFPSLKGVTVKTCYRVVTFLKEAMPIFIISAAILFVCDITGLLDAVKNALNPVMVRWLGLPRDIVDVFILALARREAAAGLIFQMVDAGKLNWVQSIVAVVVTTTCFPCFANVIAIGKEIGVKAAIVISVLICVTSFALVGALNWILMFFTGK